MHFSNRRKHLLDDAKIKRNGEPKKKRFGLNDGGGLWLLIYPHGVKIWTLIYTLRKKEQKQIKLGEYPFMNIQAARKKYDETRRLLESGEIVHHDDDTPPHFEQIAEEWHTYWKTDGNAREETHIKAWRALVNHVFPSIGKKPFNELTKQDFKDVLINIQAQGKISTAHYLMPFLKQICFYAHNIKHFPLHAFVEEKPKLFLKKHVSKPRAKISVCQTPELVQSIERFKQEAVTYREKKTAYALKFMLLVWTRTKEMLAAKKEEFDLQARLWRIPASRMKKQNDHLVPLSDQAIELIKEIGENLQEGEYLFFKDGNIDRKLLTKGLKKIGYKGRMTGHGFRGLASTTLAETGAQEAHLKAQLSHTKDATTGAYIAAIYLDFRREMMQKWANIVEKMKGKNELLPDTVASAGDFKKTKNRKIPKNWFLCFQLA